MAWKWRRLRVVWCILVRLSFWIGQIAVRFIGEHYTSRFTAEAFLVWFLQPWIVSCVKLTICSHNRLVPVQKFHPWLKFKLQVSSLSTFNRWSQKDFCVIFLSKIFWKLFAINKWLIGANWGKLHFVPQVGNDRWSPISPLHSSVNLHFGEYSLPR